jgi:hypothetical protein
MVLDILAAAVTYAAVAAGAWFIGGYMLKVYRGESHPHSAQQPQSVKLA